MKTFFQIVFGTFLALVLFTVCVGLLGIAVVVGLAKMGTNKKEPTIEKGSYLVVDMSLNVTDTPPPSDIDQSFGRLFGGSGEDTVSLRSLLGAINAAKGDNRIAGIFLTGSFEPQGYGSGFAALKEVREALQSFRDGSHKPVTAYLVDPSKRDYYLACVASKIYLNPFGEMDFTGFASEPTFYKRARWTNTALACRSRAWASTSPTSSRSSSRR